MSESQVQAAELEGALAAAREEYPNARGFSITGRGPEGEYLVEANLPGGRTERGGVAFDRSESRQSVENSRRRAVREIDEKLEEQTGTTLDPGEDYTIERTPNGYGATLTEAGLEAVRRERDRVRVSSGGFNATGGFYGGTPSSGQANAEARLDDQIDRAAGVDLKPGKDYVVRRRRGDSGQVILEPELTESGRRKARGDEFEDEVDRLTFPNPVAGFAGTGATFSVPVGALPGVSEDDATVEDVLRGTQEEISEGARKYAETTDVINPIVFAERSIRLAKERGAFGFSALDVARAEDDEGPAERQAERLVKGEVGLIGAPVSIALAGEEAREGGVEAVRRAREEGSGVRVETTQNRVGGAPLVKLSLEDEGAAPFVVEETGEYAEDVASNVGTQLSSPGGRAELAGSFIGSALLMGGAAAVSTRAGTAARYAIQPGEELVTAGASRAAPGVAAKFPGGRVDWEEPLVYGGMKAARRASGAADRVNSAARRGAAVARGDARVNVESRVGAGLVPPRISIESEGESSGTRKIGVGDISWERATSIPPGEAGKSSTGPSSVPRKAEKAGVNQQGAFVGSYSETGGQRVPRRDQGEIDWGPVVDRIRRLNAEADQEVGLGRAASEPSIGIEGWSDEEAVDGFASFATAEERSRREAAQASSFGDTDPGSDAGQQGTLRERFAQASAPMVGTLAVTGLSQEEAARQDAATEPQTATTLRDAFESRADTRSELQTQERMDMLQEQGFEQEQEVREETGQELRFDQEFGQETEQEVEVEQETGIESLPVDVGLELRPLESQKSGETGDTGRGGFGDTAPRFGPGLGAGELSTGWFGETFAAIATEGNLAAFDQSPSQAVLREEADRRPVPEELPTRLALFGSEEEKQRLEAVQNLSGFGGYDFSKFGSGDESEENEDSFDFGFKWDG